MSMLHVIYDVKERGIKVDPGMRDFKIATLNIPDDLDKLDVYETARKLAELLLEQFS